MGKIKPILMVIAVLVLIAACKPAQTVQPKNNIPNTLNVNTQKISQQDEKPLINIKNIPKDIQDLMDKSKKNYVNVSYLYKGPENTNDFYEFYLKDDKIKYVPPRKLKSLDTESSYNAVYVDKTKKTTELYCDDPQCKYKGKKEDLDYGYAYVMTPYDWIDGIDEASKISEEVFEGRKTWKLSTNKGYVWIDTFYGLPIKIESQGSIYRFYQVAFDVVGYDDVTPKT